MGTPVIGRQEQVGVAIQNGTATATAAQASLPHLALTLDRKTALATNQSGLGRPEQDNDSAVVEEFGNGSLNGKIYWNSIGYILANIFGGQATALHAGETTVYDNTFSVSATTACPYLTLFRNTPGIITRSFGLAMLSDLEIEIKQGDWVKFTASFDSLVGGTASFTASYDATEGDFTSKHATLGFATYGTTTYTTADIKSIKLKISRKTERYTPLGSIDPTSFDVNSYTFTGTIVQRWTDHVLQDIAVANTAQAMKLAIVNTDKTIGSATNPGLTFTLPKVRLETPTTDNGLDKTLSQTFNFNGQLDYTGAGYACQALLTSKVNGYVHA